MITTSQKHAIGTQKRERNSNITHQIIREESKNRRNKKGITNTNQKTKPRQNANWGTKQKTQNKLTNMVKRRKKKTEKQS